MLALKARVHNGQLVLDQPLGLPEGHELEVQVDDDGMDAEERAALHEAIARGVEDGRAGREADAADFLRELAAEP